MAKRARTSERKVRMGFHETEGKLSLTFHALVEETVRRGNCRCR
jgi:hypothetical protein